MKNILTLAVLALLAGAPQFAHAAFDGTPSTGSFTVTASTPLAAATATGSFVFSDTASLSGTVLTIGAYQFKAGREFGVGTSSNAAALNFATAINAFTPYPNSPFWVTASAPGTNTVTLTAQSSGTAYNAIATKTSNTGEVTVGAATLTGGTNNAYFCINGTCLTQSIDWYALDVSSNTAASAANAINLHPKLFRLVQALAVAGVVQLRSTSAPVTYALTSSDPTDLATNSANMTGGTAGLVQRWPCYLGPVDALPTSNVPAGCLAYLTSDPTHIQLSTKTVVSADSWLAK